jgi:hypothetical protein
MIPTISLGPWDAPSFEIMPSDLNPLLALTIVEYAPFDRDDEVALWTLLTLDGIFLSEDTDSFFRKLAEICRRVVGGELARLALPKIKASAFAGYLTCGLDEESIGQNVPREAGRFLEFLAGNPDLWPWSPRD